VTTSDFSGCIIKSIQTGITWISSLAEHIFTSSQEY